MAKEADDIRNEIRKIQLQRQLSQQRHDVTTSRLKQRFNAAQSRLRNATEFQRSNCRSIYAETLEELMGPCRPPEEARLLEVSHMIEINQHLLEIMVVHMRNLTDYMVCEINVLEGERKEIQKAGYRQNHPDLVNTTTSKFGDCRFEFSLSFASPTRSECP